MFKKSLIIIILILILSGGILVYVSFLDREEPVKPADNMLSNNTLEPDDNNGNNQNEDQADDVNNNDISEIDISDWKTYSNEEFGFEIKYPEDWTNEDSKSVILFSENGPIGNRFGFRAVEKNIYGDPFWVSIYHIPNIKNVEELEYFDFVHSGDKVYYDNYDIVKIGPAREEFFKVKEKSGSFTAYIKIRNKNYFQISYHNPEIDSLYNETEQIISTFKFINP